MFQRLRRVSQTSLTAYVYPTATGNRFEHALGVMYLADRAWQVIWSHLGSNEESEAVQAAFIAAAHDDIRALPLDPGTFGGAALAERGPLNAAELLEELESRLGDAVEQKPSPAASLWEDLTTLRVGKWIAPLATDSERFELVDPPGSD